jgi:hypothetical protein
MLIDRSQGTFEIAIVYFSGDENTPAGQFPILWLNWRMLSDLTVAGVHVPAGTGDWAAHTKGTVWSTAEEASGRNTPPLVFTRVHAGLMTTRIQASGESRRPGGEATSGGGTERKRVRTQSVAGL